MTKAQERKNIEEKLKLWDNPHFHEFLKWLEDPDIERMACKLKETYNKRLIELQPKSKYKQSKLNF